MLHTFGNRTVKLKGSGRQISREYKKQNSDNRVGKLFHHGPIRQFVIVLAISKTTVRAPEGQNHRALLACLIYLGYVHGECQSDPCKIKEIWVKL